MIGMATDDKAAPLEIFPSLSERKTPPVLEDLVVLLKSRGVAFGPPSETEHTEQLRKAYALGYSERAVEPAREGPALDTLRKELDAANQQISVHAERLGAAKAEIKHDKEVLAMLRGDNAALVASRDQYAKQAGDVAGDLHKANVHTHTHTLEIELATTQCMRADERRGFEAQIRALQHSARAAASTIEDQQTENRMKQAQILNQRDAILVLEGSLRDLQRRLDAKPSTVGEALAYVAAEASWLELKAVTPGSVSVLYKQYAYQRACEAFMWFQRATKKEES